MSGRPSKLKTGGETLREIREFEFTEADFAQACRLFNELTGMTMVRRKTDLVYGRLIRRLRATGTSSFPRYLALAANNPVESEEFVNALTTNLTSFYREPHHFPILHDHALRVKPDGGYRVWCAAASTGEEAYTIAMTLSRAYGSLEPRAQVLGTDLDTNVLRTASDGIYVEERVKNLDRDALQTFFLRGKGRYEGRVRVVSALRSGVTLRPLNLLAPRWTLTGTFDAIFLRNVLIYFSREEQIRTLARIAAYVSDDGLLFTGHSESLFYASHLFRPVGPTVYRKVLSPGKSEP